MRCHLFSDFEILRMRKKNGKSLTKWYKKNCQKSSNKKIIFL